MRCRNSAIRMAAALAIGFLPAACSGGSNWDPTEALNFLNTKKPLPGDRKAVFPEGVPAADIDCLIDDGITGLGKIEDEAPETPPDAAA